MNKLVSIVMLCWNRIDDVRESLTRIYNISYDLFEVVVVDNGSTDGTAEMIMEMFPDVRLIRMYKNIGIEAYNIGFANAKGEYIVIVDDDSFPAPEAITRMVDKFEMDPRIGAIAFDVRNFYHYDDVSAIQEDHGASTAAVSRQYYMGFNGAGVGVRKSVLQESGYYPEEFFLYNNEMDTAFRIWNADYRIEFHSDVVSYHKYSPVNRLSWRAPFFYTRNAFWLLWKNYSIDKALVTTIKLIYMCFYNSMDQRTWIYIKALFMAFIEIDRIKGKRDPVKREVASNLRVPFDIFFTFYR
ncbi:glycosyltransferase family 2 protein [Paenibacillus sp. PAMC21692]|uniref:glycosyltransferase family 2 protein n=1 Tax=Paenibacillus sp. PAMC21692 TaxID=2762320 RepID=UPI00164DB6A2|nr:glycosyltransferase family 2 protein [Paenibacillus sp. PAMC21692]QNK58372.1 glycosyltransferase family 2 protein [Paenibacillus sp. PAMC21692]